MFRGNRPVLILPGILMIVMFIGGYVFLKESDTMTNEQLQEVTEMEVTASKIKNQLEINIDWDWTTMPTDELQGDDYLSVVLIDSETGEARTDLEYSDAMLHLVHGDQIIKEVTGNVIENGVIFEFPNSMVDYTSFGNTGEATVIVTGDNLDKESIQARLLHTWTKHDSLQQVDALFQDPVFENDENVPHWIIVR